MTVHHARVIALAAVLVGIALVPSTRLYAQQTLDELPFDELRALAEQGDAEAQSTLGVMYATGQSVPQDDAEAIRWFRLAADQGNARAQNGLGQTYRTGRGVPQDAAEALRWYRLAADQGLAAAQYNLGVAYRDGEGVPQDDAEAVRWFRLAADQGDAHAQFNRRRSLGNSSGLLTDVTTTARRLQLPAGCRARRSRGRARRPNGAGPRTVSDRRPQRSGASSIRASPGFGVHVWTCCLHSHRSLC